MDIDFDPLFQCWMHVNFNYINKNVYTPILNTSRIHPNSKKRDRNLSPSKVVTFLYVGTWYMSLEYMGISTNLAKLVKKFHTNEKYTYNIL